MCVKIRMASVGVVPSSGVGESSKNTIGLDRLPSKINDMKIRDDKVDNSIFTCLSLFRCNPASDQMVMIPIIIL